MTQPVPLSLHPVKTLNDKLFDLIDQCFFLAPFILLGLVVVGALAMSMSWSVTTCVRKHTAQVFVKEECYGKHRDSACMYWFTYISNYGIDKGTFMYNAWMQSGDNDAIRDVSAGEDSYSLKQALGN